MSVITTDLNLAVRDLRQGKPVAIPTETVYGLAAPIDQEQAIRAVFAMKNRPLDHPLIVHVAHLWDLTDLVDDIPEYVQKLMTHFWPGPLTLVFNCKNRSVSPIITGGQTTVAIRCPAHPLTQQLLEQLNTPVVAPSANTFGATSPTMAEHVQQSFADTDLVILDGGRCRIGIESTIVDTTQSAGFQILRHGEISGLAIQEISKMPSLQQHSNLRVPGKLEQHYQPQKPLYYFSNYEKLTQFCQQHPGLVYAISSKQPPTVAANYFHPLASTSDKLAFDLYFQLRKADETSLKFIVIELPPAKDEWLGVRERILKAGRAG